MPTPEQILAGLESIANTWRGIAIFWHLYFAAVAAVVIHRLPSTRRIGILLAIPLGSVSFFGWVSGNPFNGTSFALLTVALITVSLRTPAKHAQKSSLPIIIVGGFLFLFGWIYPHFLHTSSIFSYLHSSPAGLIPCPSLSIVIGLALILDGLFRSFAVILGLAGVFYGIIGAFLLGVRIDFILFFGSLVLLATVFQTQKDSEK